MNAKKKGFVIAGSVIGAVVLLAVIIAGVLIFTGNRISVARCIVTDDGRLYMVSGEEPMRLLYDKDHNYKTGDKLLIVHSMTILTGYPAQTGAVFTVKTASGTAKDVPQMAFDVLCRNSDAGAGGADKELIFRITQNVEGFNFDGLDEIYGWFGAREYLGRGYKKTETSDGIGGRPKYYVSYLVTAYPDYADGGAYITQISITDPDVHMYGLTVNSSRDEFYDVFTEMGFTVSENDFEYLVNIVAEKNGIKCTLTCPKPGADDIIPTLVIKAKVTNRENIHFKASGHEPVSGEMMSGNNSEATERDDILRIAYTYDTAWGGYTDNYDVLIRGIEKPWVSSVKYLPIFKCGNTEDLKKFKESLKDSLDFSNGYDEVLSFDNISEKYTDGYFADNDLLLVYVSANSGSLRFGIKDIIASGNQLSVHVKQINNPEIVTHNMAGWLLAVSMKKADIQYYTELYAQ